MSYSSSPTIYQESPKLMFIPRNEIELKYYYPPDFLYTKAQHEIINKNNGNPVPPQTLLLNSQQIHILNEYHQHLANSKSSYEEQKLKLYYNNIASKLGELFTSNAQYIDPNNLSSLINNNNELSKEEIHKIFKHLLLYTYNATASEIVNHDEINKQLAEIKELLMKIIKPDSVVAPM